MSPLLLSDYSFPTIVVGWLMTLNPIVHCCYYRFLTPTQANFVITHPPQFIVVPQFTWWRTPHWIHWPQPHWPTLLLGYCCWTDGCCYLLLLPQLQDGCCCYYPTPRWRLLLNGCWVKPGWAIDWTTDRSFLPLPDVPQFQLLDMVPHCLLICERPHSDTTHSHCCWFPFPGWTHQHLHGGGPYTRTNDIVTFPAFLHTTHTILLDPLQLLFTDTRLLLTCVHYYSS